MDLTPFEKLCVGRFIETWPRMSRLYPIVGANGFHDAAIGYLYALGVFEDRIHIVVKYMMNNDILN